MTTTTYGLLEGRGGDEWVEATRVWNAFVGRKGPLRVWRCGSVEDVLSAVRWAIQNHGTGGIAVKGGGHNVAGLALGDESALCIILEGSLRDVSLDVEAKRVRCGGGSLASQVDGATSKSDLYVAGLGLISTTGVGGLATGGGVGWLARRYGLAIDSLESIDMVLADGTFLKGVSETHEAELFFAVRGGGGNFGIVTSFCFRLVAVHHIALRTYVFDSKMDQAMLAYVSTCAGAPDQVTALGFLTSENNLLDRFIVMVAWVPEESEGVESVQKSIESLDQACKALGSLSSFSMTDVMPLVELQKKFDAGNAPGRRYYWKSRFLESWDQVRAALNVAKHCLTNGAPARGCSVEFVPFGGAIARNTPIGCFGHRDAVMEMHSICAWDDEALDDKYVQWSRNFGQQLGATSAAAAAGNINIMGPGQCSLETTKAAYGLFWDRLVQVKRKFDPHNVFRHNHNIKLSE